MQSLTPLRDLSVDNLMEKATDLTDSTLPNLIHMMTFTQDDDDPRTPELLNCTGDIFRKRYEAGYRADDLERAISSYDRAVRLTPDFDPEQDIRLSDLGLALWTRFKNKGDLSDIDMACFCFEGSLLNEPQGVHACQRMGNLGSAFLERANLTGDNADLVRSVNFLQQVVDLTLDGHPDKPIYLNNLGLAFKTRFDCLGDVSDLEMAVSVKQKAVDLTPDGHPSKPACLANLGNAFQTRFDRLGNVSDLEMAVSVKQKAVDLTPDGHPDKPRYMSNLGNAFETRFDRLGAFSDLEMAVSVQQKAVDVTPDGHPSKPACLANLGNAFQTRFDRLGNVSDLEMAVSVKQKAVDLTPDGHPSKLGYLNNLGNAFEKRFDCLGNASDLEMAVSVKQKAVGLTPDGHPDKPSRLNNLGLAFKTRFDHLGDVSDLEMAISVKQKAVGLTPDGHPSKPGYLSNLGNAFQTRFDHLGDAPDLQLAIAAMERSVDLTPDGHLDKPSQILKLTLALMRRYRLYSNLGDLELAINRISTAAQSIAGVPFVQFQAAQWWARLSEILRDEQQTLRAYDCAFALIPRVAWMGLTIEGRHRELEQIGQLVRNAAAAAVQSGDPDRALQWLEQGRSVVWGQSLQLCSPLDMLREHDPIRADRLTKISRNLESNAKDTGSSAEATGKRHRSLILEWDALVSEVRKLDGFDDFLGPKKVSQLLTATRDSSCPIVVLNFHEAGCDALVLMAEADTVIHIPLDLNFKKAENLLDALEKVQTGRSQERYTDPIDRHLDNFRTGPARIDPDVRLKNILAELWDKVVKPVIDGLAFSLPENEKDDLPRICWCPTGPLAFLPLHAAGLYDSESPGTKVFDYVVSSYTPTVTALLQARPNTSSRPRILAIAQSTTPGQMPLPNTTQEVDHLHDRATANKMEVLVVSNKSGTVRHVLDEMDNYQWIHLACHGTQDLHSPTKSAFLLSDGNLELSEIVKHPLPNAEFAFLSACKTATGNEKLSEEAVHLAAGMMLAGYRSIIATMWSIRDRDGPVVAKVVYEEMLKDGKADYTRAAHGLHRAVHELRSSGAPFLAWMPFIHLGM